MCGVLGDVGFSRIADRYEVSSGSKSIGNDAHGLAKVAQSLLFKSHQSFLHYYYSSAVEDDHLNTNYFRQMEEEEADVISKFIKEWLIKGDECNFKEDSARLDLIFSQFKQQFSIYFDIVSKSKNNNNAFIGNKNSGFTKLTVSISNHQLVISLINNIQNKLHNLVNNIIDINNVNLKRSMSDIQEYKTKSNNNNNRRRKLSISCHRSSDDEIQNKGKSKERDYSDRLHLVQYEVKKCNTSEELLNLLLALCREVRKKHETELKILLTASVHLPRNFAGSVEESIENQAKAMMTKMNILNTTFEKNWTEMCQYIYRIIELLFSTKLITIDFIIKLKEIGFDEEAGVKETNMKYLHLSCFYLNLDIVKELFTLYPNMDVNEKAKVRNQSTPLHYLCSHLKPNSNQPKILTLLHRNGVNINQQDLKGETALMKAAIAGNYELLAALLNLNADVSIRSIEEITPIIAAARSSINAVPNSPSHENYLLCIKSLLQYGSALDPCTPLSNTEKTIISDIAVALWQDPPSRYARNNHTTKCLKTWIPKTTN